MRIWVDIVNSPQVLFLRPIISELERRGHEVVLTTRDFAQTIELADRAGLRHTPLGRHGGASRGRTIRVNLERAVALVRHLRRQRFDLAISHNSYSQAIAARLLGVPFVTMMDYEHTRPNHLAFRLARRVLVPDVFPEAALRAFGAAHKTVRYPGLKEELYLGQFVPDPDFLTRSSLPTEKTLVVVRPPAYWADYYRGKGDLFRALLRHILDDPSSFVVFLPRIAEQACSVRHVPTAKLIVPAQALDGPNLLYHADVVASAGGTMNREAALLGTPTYTVFEGLLGAVDKALICQGRLRSIRSERDLETVKIQKKVCCQPLPARGAELVAFVTDAILEAV